MKRQLLTMALAASALAPMAAQDQVESTEPARPQDDDAEHEQPGAVESAIHAVAIQGRAEDQQHALHARRPEQRPEDKPSSGHAGAGRHDDVRSEVGRVLPRCKATRIGTSARTSIARRRARATVSSASPSRSRTRPSTSIRRQRIRKQFLRDVPVFRSFRSSFAMVLRDGQSMQYASATDPISGEVMRIDVTLSLAK